MNQSQTILRQRRPRSRGERGGSSLNLLIVVALIGAGAYSVMQYAPVAYDAAAYKNKIQETVGRAAGLGYTNEWVRKELALSAIDFNVPPDSQIEVERRDGRLEANVQFTRPVVLPGYIYQYNFNYTARSLAPMQTK